jgi:hypothetical protein
MKKALSGVMAVAILACGAFSATAGATMVAEPVAELSQEITFEPFASDHIRNWTPLLSRTSYGAQVGLTGTFSGSIRVELQNSSGTTIASFTENFTNRNSIAYTRNRTTAAGTYRIRITVTINGSDTVRTSDWFRI